MSGKKAYIKNFVKLGLLFEKGLCGMMDDHRVLKIAVSQYSSFFTLSKKLKQ